MTIVGNSTPYMHGGITSHKPVVHYYDTQQQKHNANPALLSPEHGVRIWPGWIGWLEYYYGVLLNQGSGVPWLNPESYPGFGSSEKKCLKIKNKKYSVQKR